MFYLKAMIANYAEMGTVGVIMFFLLKALIANFSEMGTVGVIMFI